MLATGCSNAAAFVASVAQQLSSSVVPGALAEAWAHARPLAAADRIATRLAGVLNEAPLQQLKGRAHTLLSDTKLFERLHRVVHGGAAAASSSDAWFASAIAAAQGVGVQQALGQHLRNSSTQCIGVSEQQASRLLNAIKISERQSMPRASGQGSPFRFAQRRGFSTTSQFGTLNNRFVHTSVSGGMDRHQRRTFLSSSSDRKLDRLYEAAEEFPEDPNKQGALLKVLVMEDPHEVVRRFESGAYASNDDCVKAYLTALVETNKLMRTDLSSVLPAASHSYGGHGQIEDVGMPTNFTTAKASRAAPPSHGYTPTIGDELSPVHVVMQEPGFKSQFWRLVRTVVIMLVIISAMSQFADDSGITGRGMPSAQDIRPEAGSERHTFDDVQGADEAKEELKDIVSFLQRPEDFTRLGGRLPRGVLLMGPPGTGKTLLARAIAGEAGVPFFYCSGSEFDEVFVGVGARRVRDLFAAAKKKSPCIIFMDEIDAVGGRRSPKDQQYAKMTLNQLLVELDGFNQSDGIIVIGATNFPETLDPALVRPGRFDTHINVPLPDVRGREKILRVHAKNVPLADEKDLWTIARGTPGFSGAELANLINQAALKASQDRHESVNLATLEWAKDKILMGAERKKAVITEQDRKVTAYHEGGHALCALHTEGATPVYKATIVPRGNALGMVTQLPEDDTNSLTRQQMMARLVVCMGGRAAEEKIFGKKNVTSGASSDVEQATKLARAMVTKYAMSDKIGPMLIEDEDHMSDATRQLVESEVRDLLQTAMAEAVAILTKYETEHHRLASALLEYETLTAEEMRLVCRGKKLPKLTPAK